MTYQTCATTAQDCSDLTLAVYKKVFNDDNSVIELKVLVNCDQIFVIAKTLVDGSFGADTSTKIKSFKWSTEALRRFNLWYEESWNPLLYYSAEFTTSVDEIDSMTVSSLINKDQKQSYLEMILDILDMVEKEKEND